MVDTQTDQPWQLQLDPEGWRGVLLKANQDLHANPHDPEALQAINDANEALKVYDEAEAAGPGERITSGIGQGLEGLGQAALDLPRSLAGLVTHPVKTVLSMRDIPRNIAQGLSSNDPKQIARTVGNVGSMALPFAKTSRAAGAPSIGGLIGRAVTAPVRAAGEFLERPGLRNALLREQQGLAGARRAAMEVRGREIIPQQAKQAGLRTQLLEQQLERGPTKAAAQNQSVMARIKLMEQQLERGPATAENLALRNELLRLKLELNPGVDVESGPSTDLPPEGGAPVTPKPTPLPANPLDALRNIPPEDFAKMPHGSTPPLEQSAAAPGVQEALTSKLVRGILAKERMAARTPESILRHETPLAQTEPVENVPGAMGQKTVQFGGGSPLTPEAQAEMLRLMGQINN